VRHVMGRDRALPPDELGRASSLPRTNWTRLVPPPVLTGHERCASPSRRRLALAPCRRHTAADDARVARATAPKSALLRGAQRKVRGTALAPPAPLSSSSDTPRPSPRTNRTRRVPHPVLIGHAASLSQVRRTALALRAARAFLEALRDRTGGPRRRAAAALPPLPGGGGSPSPKKGRRKK
jgi:hypothetical protein